MTEEERKDLEWARKIEKATGETILSERANRLLDYGEEEPVEEEDPFAGMEEWEAEGFESKEKFDDFVKKSSEDSLYGYGDLVTMKELRKLLTQKPYKPKGDDAKYPDHLLLDEKTGMYYTDFFADYRTHMILANILAEECMQCENLDWERVTSGYSPYVIAHFEYVCTNMLAWKKMDERTANMFIVPGKFAMPESDLKYPGETFCDFFDWREDRAIWFADTLPVVPYKRSKGEIEYDIKLRDYGILEESRERMRGSQIRWDILTTDYTDIGYHTYDDKDPFCPAADVKIWDTNTCFENFETIYDKRGLEVLTKVVRLFQKDWRALSTFNKLGLAKISAEQKERFRHFLFEEMDFFIDEWAEKEAAKKPIETNLPEQSKSENPQVSEADFENTFSMRFRRSDEYGKLLQFLEMERNEASNGDWARYALTLLRAKIFVHSPKTFKSWLTRFCTLFGRAVPYQDPNKLSRTTCKRDITAYLPEWAFS